MRVKRNIIVKRAGTVITNTCTTKPKKTVKKVQAKKASKWGMTKTEQRLNCPMPSRNDLTNSQWREWG
jgi:hypothetical protein